MTKGFRWNALRDWVKVARELPKTRGSYPDGPIVALVFAFCKASEQAEPGTFDSLPVLRAILDATGNRRGRWVTFLVEKGDVVVLPDGRATLPNWRTFQEEGTSTERVRKHRANKRDGVSGNGDETFHGTDMERLAGAPPRRDTPHGVENTFGVRHPSDGDALSGAESGRAPGEADEPYRTAEELTGHFPVQRWEQNALRTLDALSDRRGIPAVVAALREVAPSIPTQPPAPWQLVSAARNHLEPFAPSGNGKPTSAPKGMVQPVASIREQLDAR